MPIPRSLFRRHRLLPLLAISMLVARTVPAQSTTPAPATSLPPVTVASRVGADAARAMQVLDRALLDQLPGASLQAALAWALGSDVQTRSPAQAEISLRGGSYEQTLILVDGQRMRDLQTGHFAMDLAVPWASIERIEILRGPAAAQYGADAVGGAINIVTRAAGGLPTWRARAGSFGLAEAAIATGIPLSARASATMSAERLYTDGHRPGTDAGITQLRSTLTHTGTRQRVRLDAGYGARDFGAATFYAPYNSYERTRTATVGVQADGLPTDRLATTARLGARTHTDDFVLVRTDPARYRNQHRSLQAEGELGVRLAATPSLTLAAGIEALFAHLRSARLGDRQQLRGAMYTEARHQWSPRSQAFLGARVDGGTGVGTVFVPSGGVSVGLTPTVHGRLAYAGGWRQPTWTDRYYVDPSNRGTASLIPERFGSTELGVTWQPRRGGLVEVTAFSRDGAHTIDWVRQRGQVPPEPWVASNVGMVRLRGAEWLATTPRVLGVRWTVRGTLLRATADVAPGIEGKYALRPLTRTAGVTAQLGKTSRWLLIDATHAQRVGERAYTTVNARAGLQLSRWARGATLTVDGTNLGRARALDASGVPMAGPAMAVGLQWRGRAAR